MGEVETVTLGGGWEPVAGWGGPLTEIEGVVVAAAAAAVATAVGVTSDAGSALARGSVR